ncbi:MAG: GspE/PulE family protein [Synergistes sp.]|nr:GspE/PulE family protein [Synergistes sp.]
MNKIIIPALGTLLAEKNLLSENELLRACREAENTKKSFVEILTENGFAAEDKVAHELCDAYKFPFVSFVETRPRCEVLKLLPENTARHFCVIPLEVTQNGKLCVAMADPLAKGAADEIALHTGRDTEIKVALVSDIKKAINRYYPISSAVAAALTETEKEKTKITLRENTENSGSPVARLADMIIEQAARENASDIHIEPDEDKTRIRFRVDGRLWSVTDIPCELHQPLTARIKILSGMDIAEKRRPQDGRILIKKDNMHIDIRVSTMPSVYGEKTVLRLLDRCGEARGIDALGFNNKQQSALLAAINASNGIVLVTGPTGSGKSTTLYSLLNILNEPSKNIITLEDPVEFTINGLTQVQVNEKIGLTFSHSLRSVLRQDPDIIMVGEIRDAETAQLAVRAALTGHLVLSTLHTNDAPTAVSRLVDMGVPRFLIASSLRAVVAQRLVRTLCPKCKRPVSLPPSLAKERGFPKDSAIFEPVGCPECRFTGYKGRTVIAEIMPVTSEMRTMISEAAEEDEIRRCACACGMTMLYDDAKIKVCEGITGIDEMLFTTMAE